MRHNGTRHDRFPVILFPFVLLGFVLFMERVEEPLSQVAVEREMEEFLDSASADELDTFVREGAESALTRFRQRIGFRWLRRHRRAERSSPVA